MPGRNQWLADTPVFWIPSNPHHTGTANPGLPATLTVDEVPATS
ncbi:hypothetical protein D805_1776 [Bifidobacterium thermophilum RBL67]|uniref:Uncharacterized protein n=1 Tax=Bifidobacterium thermophilum RBL67 TaxID=1254439 RepID=M4RHK3_9BIFI|nr:hypothetical protein D805_1776 [Bifidobacterium thermophilum RBL67]